MLSISTCKKSEYESMWHYTFQQKEYNYKVFRECGIILQVYYITRRHKNMTYTEWTVQKMLMSFKRKSREAVRRKTGGEGAKVGLPSPEDKLSPQRKRPL